MIACTPGEKGGVFAVRGNFREKSGLGELGSGAPSTGSVGHILLNRHVTCHECGCSQWCSHNLELVEILGELLPVIDAHWPQSHLRRV